MFDTIKHVWKGTHKGEGSERGREKEEKMWRGKKGRKSMKEGTKKHRQKRNNQMSSIPIL